MGLSSESLLAVAEDSDTGCDIEMPSKVTNEVMLDLLNFMNNNAKCSYYTYWQWVTYLFKTVPRDCFPTINSLRQSVVRLSTRLTKLKKMPTSGEKSSVLSDFLNAEYTLPHIFIARDRVVSQLYNASDESSSCSSCAELKDLVDKSRKKSYAVHRNAQKTEVTSTRSSYKRARDAT